MNVIEKKEVERPGVDAIDAFAGTLADIRELPKGHRVLCFVLGERRCPELGRQLDLEVGLALGEEVTVLEFPLEEAETAHDPEEF